MTTVVYNRKHARSIVSAALVMLKYPGTQAVEIGDLKGLKPEAEDTIYIVADDVEFKVPEGCTVKYIEEDKGKKKRLRILFEELFPKFEAPRFIHLLSGENILGKDVEEVENLKYGIVSALDLEASSIGIWRNIVIVKNIVPLAKLIEDGKIVRQYLSKTGVEVKAKLAAPALKLAEGMMEISIDELKAKDAELKLLNKVVTDEIIIAKATPTQIKDRYKVTELKEIAKRNNLKKYSALREDDLIKFLKKNIK